MCVYGSKDIFAESEPVNILDNFFLYMLEYEEGHTP